MAKAASVGTDLNPPELPYVSPALVPRPNGSVIISTALVSPDHAVGGTAAVQNRRPGCECALGGAIPAVLQRPPPGLERPGAREDHGLCQFRRRRDVAIRVPDSRTTKAYNPCRGRARRVGVRPRRHVPPGSARFDGCVRESSPTDALGRPQAPGSGVTPDGTASAT